MDAKPCSRFFHPIDIVSKLARSPPREPLDFIVIEREGKYEARNNPGPAGKDHVLEVFTLPLNP
jgi:hypothetical protein